MKKGLILLPLLAGLALCGCNKDDKGDNKGGGDFGGLTMDVETLGEVENKDVGGYSRLADVTEMDGVEVSFTSVMTNGLNSTSIPKWSTPDDEKVQVIQMKGSASEITVTGKISTMTLRIYSSYSWAESGLPTVTFDETKVKKPSKASDTEDTEYESFNKDGTKSFALKIYTCVYTVNAKEEGVLSIANANSFALYLDSIVLE